MQEACRTVQETATNAGYIFHIIASLLIICSQNPKKMSVLMQFAIPYVSRVIAMIRESGLPYQLSAMGTIIETETLDEAQLIIKKAYELLSKDCTRVYCTVTFDIRDGKPGRMSGKIAAIEGKIGPVNH
jgi:uncharacterized protein YqgV (UPF0045/DUF77 family)